ncbi:glycoside hydrolase family 92 [Pyrenophora seminiperda CCB06]|uniref:Glycoside hydrolase family 92 n=1 Tax=Pyrenophora seminiperda CCB06 TaxID=1302712 RepID=A0A3M7M2M4_9PLEO|nr:glycoside hydrolase family 92 [Pyrenophora seminiperda CCB06]
MARANNNSPIPSYEEAVMVAPVTRSSQEFESPVALERRDSANSCTLSSSWPLPDMPPAYAVVDEKATIFTIYGTMIHTPNAPAYQLSSFLGSRVDTIKLRRLCAEEVTVLQSGAQTIPFNDRSVLYETHGPSFLSNDYYIEGQHRSTLPGLLHMSFGLRRWHVVHIPIPTSRPVELMTCGKNGGLKKTITQRKNEMEPSVWKDAEGNVIATEVMQMCNGAKMPTLELRPGLDQTCRELILALWVSRLWMAFGRKAYMT